MINWRSVSKIFISTTCSLHSTSKPEKKDSLTGGYRQKQLSRSLCSHLGCCHLSQARQRLDDADPLLRTLQVLSQAQDLSVKRLRLLLIPETMEPHIPDVDQDHPERPPIPGLLHERLELLIQGA